MQNLTTLLSTHHYIPSNVGLDKNLEVSSSLRQAMKKTIFYIIHSSWDSLYALLISKYMYFKVKGDLVRVLWGPNTKVVLLKYVFVLFHHIFGTFAVFYFHFERISLQKLNKLFIYKYFYEHQILQFQILYPNVAWD